MAEGGHRDPTCRPQDIPKQPKRRASGRHKNEDRCTDQGTPGTVKRAPRGVPQCLVLTAHQHQLGGQRPEKPGGSYPPVTSNHRGPPNCLQGAQRCNQAGEPGERSREAREGDHIPSSDWPSVSADHTRLLAPGGFLSCFILNTCAVPAILWALERQVGNKHHDGVSIATHQGLHLGPPLGVPV